MKLEKITLRTAYTATTRDQKLIVLTLEKRGFSIDKVREVFEKIDDAFARENECNGISIDSFGCYQGEENVFCLHVHTTFTEDSYAVFYRLTA